MAIEPPYSSTRSATIARPRPDPGRGLVGAHAALQHIAAQRRRHARAVVVDDDVHVTGAGLRRHAAPSSGPTCRRCRAGCRASRRGPRAARARRSPSRDGGPNRQTALGVELASACGPAPPPTRRRWPRRRASRPRPPPGHGPGGSRSAGASGRPAGAARSERGGAAAPRSASRAMTASGRLQAVGQIAGPRQRPPHRLARGDRAAC